MTLNEWFVASAPTSKNETTRYELFCKDGFWLSVQASRIHYCRPKVNNAPKYDSVEIACLAVHDIGLSEYLEDSMNWDGEVASIYYNVPCEKVERIIEEHGGIDESRIRVNAIEM